MSYLARLLTLIFAFTGISGPVVTLRPGDSASDSIMGDVEDPTAFATTYTSPLAWDDGGVVIKGRAWGEFEKIGFSETAEIGLEFCGETVTTSIDIMPDELDYWRMDFEIVYYSISGSSDGAYYASGDISYGPNKSRNLKYEFYVEVTSITIPDDGSATVKFIGDWQTGATDTNDLRLYSLIAIATD